MQVLRHLVKKHKLIRMCPLQRFGGKPNSKGGRSKIQSKDRTVVDYRKHLESQREEQQQLEGEKKEVFVKAMVIHPIYIPNKGLENEVYLAEEAIGLAKSLNWTIIQAPFNKLQPQVQVQQQPEEIEKEEIQKVEEVEEEVEEEKQIEVEDQFPQQYQKSKKIIKKMSLKERILKMRMDKQKEKLDDEENKLEELEEIRVDGWRRLKDNDEDNEKIRDGDYVYTSAFKGIYHEQKQLLELDLSDSEDDLLQWQNNYVRNQLALSSLVKIKDSKTKTLLNNRIMTEVAEHIKLHQVNAIFINTTLTQVQTKNLEKIFTAIANNQSLKDVFKSRNPFYNTDYDTELQTQTESELISDHESTLDNQQSTSNKHRKVKVFDRFTIILQIFAKRMQNKASKLQVELAYLKFIRQKLQKGGNSYSAYYNIFKGDLMMAKEIKYEVVSAKQKNVKGSLGGSGEQQMDLERRIIQEKEKKLRVELEQYQKNSRFLREKRRSQTNAKNMGQVAIIGYTNSGKSQLMNQLLNKQVVASEDMLFQTLQSTQRELFLPSGQKALLQDTVGFITNLPHALFDSFHSCLEDIHQADIVLHLIDISNPFWQDQKQAVFQVLKQMQLDSNFYNNKLVEVWNKIDQVDDEKYKQLELFKQINGLAEGGERVCISALTGENTEHLLELVEQKMNKVLDKELFNMVHCLQEHHSRLKWLTQNANVTHIQQPHYQYSPSPHYPYGKVTFQILLDQVTYRRYNHTFNNTIKTQRGLPPPGWKNS